MKRWLRKAERDEHEQGGIETMPAFMHPKTPQEAAKPASRWVDALTKRLRRKP